jgi:hypothetical protein
VDKNNLWNLVYTASSMKSLLTTCIKTKDPNVIGHLENLGLVIGHAYCIIEAVEIFFNIKSNSFDKLREPVDKQGQLNSIKLLKYFLAYIFTFLAYKSVIFFIFRLKNPWGYSEFRTFNLRSNECNLIDPNILKLLEESLTNHKNGCFIISFDDFFTFFENLEFVHVDMNAYSNNGLVDSFHLPVTWECKKIYGEFVCGLTAGGSGKNNRHDFWLNPQYKLNLVSKHSQNNSVRVIVDIMQMEQVRRREEFDNSFADSNAPIAFSLFKIKCDFQMKTRRFSHKELTKIFNDSNYVGQRELSKRFDLEQGSYVLIPSLYEKDVNMKIFIRVYIH